MGAEPVSDAALSLVAVSVGMPVPHGQWRGHEISSGFRKQRVTTDSIFVGETNLTGDGQGDLKVHGGIFKAVYAYPADHLPVWSEELELAERLGPNAFGENLTTLGMTEAEARVGDLWHWGEAILQICQPRWPCFKLTMATGRAWTGRRMHKTGRTGWYLRVLQTGEAPVAGPILVERDGMGISVLDAHRANADDADPALVARVAAHPALAPRWREQLEERLANQASTNV